MLTPDIRWKQRLQNYENAIRLLHSFAEEQTLSERDLLGFVKAFELTYELAWKMLKNYLEFQGSTTLIGSRDTFRLAIERGVIDDGVIWFEMIKSRNAATHTYDHKSALDVISEVKTHYLYLLNALADQAQEWQM